MWCACTSAFFLKMCRIVTCINVHNCRSICPTCALFFYWDARDRTSIRFAPISRSVVDILRFDITRCQNSNKKANFFKCYSSKLSCFVPINDIGIAAFIKSCFSQHMKWNGTPSGLLRCIRSIYGTFRASFPRPKVLRFGSISRASWRSLGALMIEATSRYGYVRLRTSPKSL